MTFDEVIKPVREDIDRVDKELLQLLVKRMQCSERVAAIKEEYSIPVLNVKREQEILDRVREEAGEYGDSAAALYSAIMAVSRERQHSILAENSGYGAVIDHAPVSMNISGKKIICQGVEGAYSNTAANRFFGEESEIVFKPQFADIFAALENREGDFGVVPVENSAAGSVSEVYSLIMSYKFFICGAVNVFVNHCLCTVGGQWPEKVISHPQALLQCAEFIKKNKLEKVEFSNTAAAAKRVAESGGQGLGAICSREAAEKYGLTIIREGIQDSKNNHTRFAVISPTAVLPIDAEKISLSFVVPNTTGSLYRVLERFALNGLNLTKIESRPIKNSNFDYEFYLDFSGNIHSPRVKSLICTLKDELKAFAFLGNYNEIV